MKLIVCLVFVWKMVDTLQSAKLSCARLQLPHLWKQHGGSCYLFLASRRKHGPAVDFCQSQCAELTAPTTDQENELVLGMLRDYVEPDINYKIKMWLGCNNTNGAWVCLGDTPGRKYRNWFQGVEPETENACAVMRHKDGKWEGPECDVQWPKFTLCKTPATGGPISPITLKCTSMPTPSGLCPDPVHTVKVTSPMQCCLACAKHCNCRSFSLTHSLDCQMNLGKINDVSTTLRNQACEYYEYEM